MNKPAEPDRTGIAINSIDKNKGIGAIVLWDMRKCLAHEMGHYLVARHFRLEPVLRVWRVLDAVSSESNTFGGNCLFSRTTAFRRCCIGWAGEVGDCVYFNGQEDAQELFWQVLEQWESERETISASDLRTIAEHTQPRRALKIAVGILVDKASSLRSTVDGLVEQFIASGESAVEYS